ncbi:hypothetical protein P8452_41780 [Trifolium repens]|nr:hypothetical protein P8452_41780 [Trifolium repens]
MVAYVDFRSCCSGGVVEGIVAACYWKSTGVMTEEKRKSKIHRSEALRFLQKRAYYETKPNSPEEAKNLNVILFSLSHWWCKEQEEVTAPSKKKEAVTAANSGFGKKRVVDDNDANETSSKRSKKKEVVIAANS